MNFMHWHCLRQSCWFSLIKYTSTRMYCVKVIFLCCYSTPPTLSSPPSGTHLTGLTSLKHWWRHTRGSWRTWETCADRCASWRSATPCTCSAPVNWRKNSAGPTLSAISWTPTRDRQEEWHFFLFWHPSDPKHSLACAPVWKTVQPVLRTLANTHCSNALWLAGSWASHQALSRGHESWEMAVWVQEPSRQVRRSAEGERSELTNLSGNKI